MADLTVLLRGFVYLLSIGPFLTILDAKAIDLLDQNMDPIETNYCNDSSLLAGAGLVRSPLGQFLGYECSAEFYHCRRQSDGFRTYKKSCRVGLVYDTLGTQNCNYDYNVKGCAMSKAASSCNVTQFACTMSEECVEMYQRCDGHYDCAMEEDEQNCPMCAAGEFACVVSEECVPLERRCNGLKECTDGSDENNCELCGPGKFFCGKSGECIEGEERCDGERNCPHGEDEMMCRVKPVERRFTCESRDAYIAMHQVCDGVANCPDASDELYCDVHVAPAPDILPPPPGGTPTAVIPPLSSLAAHSVKEETPVADYEEEYSPLDTTSSSGAPKFPLVIVEFPTASAPASAAPEASFTTASLASAAPLPAFPLSSPLPLSPPPSLFSAPPPFPLSAQSTPSPPPPPPPAFVPGPISTLPPHPQLLSSALPGYLPQQPPLPVQAGEPLPQPTPIPQPPALLPSPPPFPLPVVPPPTPAAPSPAPAPPIIVFEKPKPQPVSFNRPKPRITNVQETARPQATDLTRSTVMVPPQQQYHNHPPPPLHPIQPIQPVPPPIYQPPTPYRPPTPPGYQPRATYPVSSASQTTTTRAAFHPPSGRLSYPSPAAVPASHSGKTEALHTQRSNHYPTVIDESAEAPIPKRDTAPATQPRTQVVRSLRQDRRISIGGPSMRSPGREERAERQRYADSPSTTGPQHHPNGGALRVSRPARPPVSTAHHDDTVSHGVQVTSSPMTTKKYPTTVSFVNTELLKKIGAKLDLHSGQSISSKDLLSRIEKVLRDELPVHTRSIQGGSGSDWQGRQESSKTGRNSTVKRNTSLNEKKVRESEGSIVTTTKSPFKITIRTSSNGVTSAGKGKAGNLRRPRTTTAKPGEAIKPEKDEVLNGREYLNETQSNETETKTTKVIFQLLPGKR